MINNTFFMILCFYCLYYDKRTHNYEYNQMFSYFSLISNNFLQFSLSYDFVEVNFVIDEKARKTGL